MSSFRTLLFSAVLLPLAGPVVGCKKEGALVPPVGPGDRVVEAVPPKKDELPPPPPVRPDALERVGFALDSSALDAEARATLERDAALLGRHPDVRVELQGHCDERGTTEYNLALGDRRAKAAKKYLSGLGVAGSRLSTVSYGEERPLDPDHDESAWGQNRRVELRVSSGGDGTVDGSTP